MRLVRGTLVPKKSLVIGFEKNRQTRARSKKFRIFLERARFLKMRTQHPQTKQYYCISACAIHPNHLGLFK